MPWSDFETVTLKAIGRSEYLCLFLGDTKNYRHKISLFRRAIHTSTQETGCGDLLVNLSDMGLNPVETVALVQRQVELAKTNPKPASAVKYPSAE